MRKPSSIVYSYRLSSSQFTMSTQRLISLFTVCMSLFVMAEMFRINSGFNEFQRSQRGFGNRRTLASRLKHHYPQELIDAINNQDNVQNGRHLFRYPYNSIEQNGEVQQPQSSSMDYR